MVQEDSPAPILLTPHLYFALSIAERASYLRQTGKGWIEPKVDKSRAAAILDRWKSRSRFPAGDSFEQRLRLDGLTEEELLAILGLPPEVYSELITASPDWLRELDKLYLTPRSPDDDPEFLRYTKEGTNGFLWIAYPLLREGLRRFREEIFRLPTVGVPFDPVTAEHLVLPHLLKSLKETLNLVMVLELNVARVQGALKGETPEERFHNFCERLRQMDVQLSIAREYPVLFRSLHMITMNWVHYSLELLDRLSKDWTVIRRNLVGAAEAGSLTSILLGVGDTHRRGRTVAILNFSTGFKLVYKPHSQSVDVHFGEFLEWLNQGGFETPFRILKIIDRGCYAWSEFVAHQPCSNRQEVERFYQRLGGYLAAFYVIRTRDIHFQNLIAIGEFPMPVDLETSFHNETVADKDDPAINAFQSSVMQVMLLPQPGYGSEADEGVDMSGFGASSYQQFPLGKTLCWERAGTDEMRVGRSKTIPMIVANNRPKLDGQEVAAEEYVEPFLRGFRWVYRFIEECRDEFRAVLDRFSEDEVRFVARGTATYAVLLGYCLQPDQLRNAIDRDQMLDSLWLDALQRTRLIRLIPAEVRDIQNGDVPVFTSRPNSRDLWTSEGERIPDVFEQPAMVLVREGLSRLGEEDLARQESLIRTAIGCAAEGAASPALAPRKLLLTGRREPIDLACAVGDRLCRDALENEFGASWIGTAPAGPGRSTSIQPVDLGLYEGLSGCALFLAYLAAASGDQSYERIAKKTCTLLRRHLDRRRAGGRAVPSVGAFTGLGGIVYTLAHLAVLWDDASLIEEAKALAADVPALIESDKALDVIGGSAGAIVALEVLNRISASDDLLNAAVLCGERLLLQQQPQGAGVGWTTEVASTQPLTGFSHGAAGIAWALLKLAAWSGESRFRETAEAAIAYERSSFVAEEANWPDYRVRPGEEQSYPRCEVAWCHGAPGIGLARVDSLQQIDDRETREEIAIALRKTLQSPFGLNHCLCHGDLGNLDILLYAARRVDDSWWSEAANRLARETLVGIAERGYFCSMQTFMAPPGLMVGLAGIGHGLLRLASPERIPSVLVLAPPAQV
ncbi:MAG: type 2 lantipeptide synthetase LanM [Acidobacteria bacterium]|nr:MAG: type 2 lantipeptide synthetase LanM [Acidobacteriota bacterium]